MKNTSSKTEKIGGSRAVIFGIPIFSSRRGELIKGLESVLSEKTGKCLIYTPNPEILVESKQNPELAQALKSAEVNIPDGIGVVLANRVMARLGRSDVRIQERIAGADLAEVQRVQRDVLPMLREKNPMVAPHVERIINERFKVLQADYDEEGAIVKGASTNDPKVRIAATEQMLSNYPDGDPLMEIDPSCKWYIEALRSKYRYPKIKSTGGFSDNPEKNNWYLMM